MWKSAIKRDSPDCHRRSLGLYPNRPLIPARRERHCRYVKKFTMCSQSESGVVEKHKQSRSRTRIQPVRGSQSVYYVYRVNTVCGHWRRTFVEKRWRVFRSCFQRFSYTFVCVWVAEKRRKIYWWICFLYKEFGKIFPSVSQYSSTLLPSFINQSG